MIQTGHQIVVVMLKNMNNNGNKYSGDGTVVMFFGIRTDG